MSDIYPQIPDVLIDGLVKQIENLRAENEKLQHKLHDAIVKYQRLLMQYEPEKAAAGASATFDGDENVG